MFFKRFKGKGLIMRKSTPSRTVYVRLPCGYYRRLRGLQRRWKLNQVETIERLIDMVAPMNSKHTAKPVPEVSKGGKPEKNCDDWGQFKDFLKRVLNR